MDCGSYYQHKEQICEPIRTPTAALNLRAMSTLSDFPEGLTALLWFDDTGTSLQFKSIGGALSEEAATLMVRMVLGSASVAQALNKPFEMSPCVTWMESLNDTSQTLDIVEVCLHDDFSLLALPMDKQTWLAVMLNKFTDYETELSRALLPAYIHAAQDLAEHKLIEGDILGSIRAQAFTLWSNMSNTIRFSGLHIGENPSSPFRRALVGLAAERRIHKASFYANVRCPQNDQNIIMLATKYCTKLGEIITGRLHAVLVFKEDNTILHSMYATLRAQQVILWYYKHIANVKNQVSSSRQGFFELSETGFKRIWFYRKGMIVYTHISSTADPNERTCRSLRHEAFDLLNAIQEFRPP